MEAPEALSFAIVFRNVVNFGSILCSVATMVILFRTIYYKCSQVNRMTLRFQFLISIIGFARHVVLSGISLYDSPEDSIKCELIAAAVSYFDQVYVLLNSYSALNTHLVYIFNVMPDFLFQYVYIFCSFVLALIVNIHMIGFEQYGLNKDGNCHFRDTKERFISRVIAVYAAMGPGVLYCGLVFLSVWFKLRKNIKSIKLITTSNEVAKDKQIKKMEALYYNISLFPLSCFVLFGPYLLGNFLIDYDYNLPYFIIYFYRLLIRLPGIVNFMILTNDHQFYESYIYLKNKICKGFTEIWNSLRNNKSIEYSKVFEQVETDDLPTFDDDTESYKDWKVDYGNGDKQSLREHLKYI